MSSQIELNIYKFKFEFSLNEGSIPFEPYYTIYAKKFCMSGLVDLQDMTLDDKLVIKEGFSYV